MSLPIGDALRNVAFLALALGCAAPAFAQVKPEDAATPPANVQRFGDWVRQCDPPQEGRPESCFLLQKTVEKSTGKQVMAVGVGYYGEKQVPAVIVTAPLGIFLPAGVTLTVPGIEPVRIVIETCTPQGCRGGAALADPVLAAMKKGDRAEIAMEDPRRRPVKLPVSLQGFTAGFASLKKG